MIRAPEWALSYSVNKVIERPEEEARPVLWFCELGEGEGKQGIKVKGKGKREERALPADSMHVVFHRQRERHVQNKLHLGNIESSSCHVGCHK